MFQFVATFLCLGAFVRGSPHWTTPVSAAVLIHGAAPLGADGRVVDTPEVAVAKVAHQAAFEAAVAEAWTTPPPAWVAPSAWVTPPPPAWLTTPSPPVLSPVTSWVPVVPPRVDGRVAPAYYAARAAAAAAAAEAVW